MAQSQRNLTAILVRAAAVLLGLAAWFTTQHLIGSRPPAAQGQIGDQLLASLAPIHDFLIQHVPVQNALLIVSSAIIDFLGIFLLAKAIFGKTVRPFVGLLIVFILRQICQTLCILPAPQGMIWPAQGPGFPSLLVTYGVSNDLFFSGHSALAVYGAIELARLRRWLLPISILIALFEMSAVLALRAHWTMDVYAGAVTAVMAAFLAEKISPAIDRQLARFPRAQT